MNRSVVHFPRSMQFEGHEKLYEKGTMGRQHQRRKMGKSSRGKKFTKRGAMRRGGRDSIATAWENGGITGNIIERLQTENRNFLPILFTRKQFIASTTRLAVQFNDRSVLTLPLLFFSFS